MGTLFKGKLTVLLVDDEEDTLFLIRHKLEKEGFNIQISPNGMDMMDIIARTHPDLIVLDIHMNGIDGGSVCQLLKSNSSTAAIPVVMFSANDNIDKIAKECGADGYIRKPFNGQEFKNTFSSLLNKG
jgi:DNA-binding response OmpR family regulator